MTVETQSNAEKRVRGFFRSGYDYLVDDDGVPVKFVAWNMIRRTYSDRVQPISNQEMAETSFQSVRVSREVAPIKKWAPAKQGANARFSGIMSQDFPELAKLKDEQLDSVAKSLRRHEFDK